ncbi:trehalose-6-phosphate synthase [Deinobacterium chartae]|uniref:Trehalose-6-phosphate synthase n=1 Tax=Deinobacterium chartae TaxID=521158 RepID=A0A841I0E4_9DEIO|nr:trehalose-6-phosphate synthase [Deinobacterium chartae]MBB6098663.1 trehalose-6-phosphate synthase [Deinobacterium chartae]
MALIVASARAPVAPDAAVPWQAVRDLSHSLWNVLRASVGTLVTAGEPGDLTGAVRLGLTQTAVQGAAALHLVCSGQLSHAELRAESWEALRSENARFAREVARVYQPGDLIVISGLELILLPGILRAALPQARLLLLWPHAFAAAGNLQFFPWHRELLGSMLAADAVFLQDRAAAANLEVAAGLLGATASGGRVSLEGRTVRLASLEGLGEPGIDTVLAQSVRVQADARQLRQRLGVPVVLSADQLDYPAGLIERLQAFETFLRTRTRGHGRVTLVSVAAPVYERLGAYQRLAREVDRWVGRLNGRYAQGTWVPVQYLRRPLSCYDVAVLYAAADVLLATPLCEGPHAPADEWGRLRPQAPLVLSHAASPDGHPRALRVNPYDAQDVAEALGRALRQGGSCSGQLRGCAAAGRTGGLTALLRAEQAIAARSGAPVSGI